MAINVIVQSNDRSLPDNLLLNPKAPIIVWFDGAIIAYYYYHTLNYVLQ